MKLRLIALLMLLTPSVSLAAGAPNDIKIPDTFQAGPHSVVVLINTIANWMFTLLLVLGVIFILIASFNYLTANGSEEKITKAHKILIYAVVAITVGVLARGIVAIVYRAVAPNAASPSVLDAS